MSVIGTHVRVVSTTAWRGQIGAVLDYAAGQFRVDVDPGPVWFFPNELETAPPENEAGE